MATYLSVSHPESCFMDDGWIWVDQCLVPGYQCQPDEWWTGHRDVAPNDDVLLYVTAPHSAIRFLLVGLDHAHEIAPHESKDFAGRWGFRYEAVFFFQDGLTFTEMRAMPHLAGWAALRGRFQGTGFEVPTQVAAAVHQALETKNPAYARYRARAFPGATGPKPLACTRCGSSGVAMAMEIDNLGLCEQCARRKAMVASRRARLRGRLPRQNYSDGT